MIIHIIIRSVIKKYGKDIIGGRQLLNILSDLTAFRYEVPALRNTLGIILDTYGLKILNAQALDKPGAVTLNQYKHDFCESYGMREDIAEYVFDSLGYGIGWIQYISSNVINKSVLDDKESKYRCFALMYYYMGFNTYDIQGSIYDKYTSFYEDTGLYNYIDYADGRPIDTFKHPTNESEKNKDIIHDLKDIEAIDRSKSTGIGCFTGYNDIVAFDIDYIFCTKQDSDSQYELNDCIKKYLTALGLPDDYQWVVRSISGRGIHIIVKVKDVLQLGLKSTALKPTKNTPEDFGRIEVIWNKNIALPPTTGRSNGQQYLLYQNPANIPTCEPSYITMDQLNNFLDYYCGITNWTSFSTGSSYLVLFYRGKQSSHHDSMGGYCFDHDDAKWVPFCESEIGQIAYAAHLASKKEFDKAYTIFTKYNSEFACFNAASLIAYGAVHQSKSIAMRLYERIGHSQDDGGWYSCCLKILKEQIEKM